MSSSVVHGVGMGNRRVVYSADVDGEALLGAGVHSAIGRATVVVELHANRCAAVGVIGGRVGERAVGVDRRLPPAVNRSLLSLVTSKVNCWPFSSARPAEMSVAQPLTALRSGVLVYPLVVALLEARRIVYGVDVDGEGLLGALVLLRHWPYHRRRGASR